MIHQVTPEQYTRLLDARNNWPTHLTYGTRKHSYEFGCMLNHLADNVGIVLVKSEVSKMYGIPKPILDEWIEKNDSPFLIPLGQRIRAMRMFYSFDRFLDSVKVVPQSDESDLENSLAEFEEENQSEVREESLAGSL